MKPTVFLLILSIVVLPAVTADITVTFTTTYSGAGVTLTPNVSSNITSYKWNVSEYNSVYNGSTGWVNATTPAKYHYTFYSPDSIFVTLYVRNTTDNGSYKALIESFYTPPIVYEEYDYEDTIHSQGIKTTNVGNDFRPWYTLSTLSSGSKAMVSASLVLIGLVFVLFSTKIGRKGIRLKDYIILSEKIKK